MKSIIFVLVFLLIGISNTFAYAEEVLVTLSTRLDDVDFDGIWSYTNEWKPSSLIRVQNDDSSFVYRIAHDYENLFVYVSATSDETPSKTADRAMVCIDGENNGGDMPDTNDYCFITYVGTSKVHTLQGGSSLGQNGYYKTIDNHPELIGIGAISSQLDRYSKVPHSSYEFKIPIEVFGKSNVYGLYIGVFDSDSTNQYGWPQDALENIHPFIPSPESWGEMISPDKSLPEFEMPLLMLSSTLILIVVLAKRKVDLFN